MLKYALPAALAAAFAFPAAACAQQRPAAAATAPLDARAAVAEVRRIIAERYVLPERRPALDAVLAEGLASGRYQVSDPATLADRINADLERVGRDRHLNFRYDPRAAANFGSAGSAPPSDPSGYERQARARNHGIFELKLLPGNIRYMDYRGFDWIGDETRTALNAALTFLSGGDAIVIDLRRNGGGSPDAVQHIVSHFMEANRPLVTFHMNGEPSPDTRASLAELQLPRMVGKPLYVLTGRGTGSAAEEFSGHVGGYRLGELVGETTAGAGFRNDVVAISGGFLLSVSVGRAVLASTGRDWEAVGIAPTMPTPVADALTVAQAHALRRLAAGAEGPRRAALLAVAEGLDAMARRPAPAAPIAAYAGSYGERHVTLDGGILFYQVQQRPKRELVALGGHDFAFVDEPGHRVRFQFAGEQATGFEVGPATGPAQGPYARTGG